MHPQEDVLSQTIQQFPSPAPGSCLTEATTGQWVVLLADGEVLVRNLLRRILEESGFLVLSAATASEALTIAGTSGNHIDLLIADVDVPGMTGVSLAEEITRSRPDMLVLLISAGSTRGVPTQFPFLPKPFPPRELASRLAGMLEVRTRDAA